MASVDHTKAPNWTTELPATWPKAPASMTVSSIGEIEACPRQWALAAAQYPHLWKGRGYPPRLQVSALEGTVIHTVLETIIRELAKSNCLSVDDPRALQIMRELGGYTELIANSIDKALHHYKTNPRAVRLIDDMTLSLHSRAPQIRNRVQAMLSRRKISSVAKTSIEKQSGGPLGYGLFPEIVLKANHIGWKGKADLLVLSHDACEIIDFKTGKREEHHPFQLQVYALLWSRDTERNPSGRLANRLVLAYQDGDVEVEAPTVHELAEIKQQLVKRRTSADQILFREPPEARPDSSRCGYCVVRQLCDEYWNPRTPQGISPPPDKHVFDIELEIDKKHGEFSWDGKVTSSDHLPVGKKALLRTIEVLELTAGVRLRILAAAVTLDQETQDLPAIITLGRLSEVYVVV